MHGSTPIPRFPDGLVLEHPVHGLLDITPSAWADFCTLYSNPVVKLRGQTDFVRELEKVFSVAEPPSTERSPQHQRLVDAQVAPDSIAVDNEACSLRFLIERKDMVVYRVERITRFKNAARMTLPGKQTRKPQAKPAPRTVRPPFKRLANAS